LGIILRKGAGLAVNAAAADLVKRHEPGILRRLAKLHFKNARVFDEASAGDGGVAELSG